MPPPHLPIREKLLHLDPVGVALAIGAITCFMTGLQYAGVSYAWKSSVVIGLLVGFVVTCAALALWQLYLGGYAMMTPRLYANRAVSAAAGFQFFFMDAWSLLLYYLPTYFQSALGATPSQSGVNNLPLVLAAAVFSIAGGGLASHTGRA